MYLALGDFSRGWREIPWMAAGSTPSHFLQPIWDGSPLAGQRIFIWGFPLIPKLGLGDAIFFSRFAAQVKARGGYVILGCQQKLTRLLRGCPGVDETTSEVPNKFDTHISVCALPYIFRTTEATIPPCHIVPATEDVTRWRCRLNQQGLRVGIIWAGNPDHPNDHNRSCRLANFAPLAQIPGVSWFLLQKGPATIQAIWPPQGMNPQTLGGDLYDLAETAAVIANMDLVISVDTAVCHIAGAMRTPVWTLLPYAADWRWQLDREDSPWYPTMRLFRQARPGDWGGGGFHRVASALTLRTHTLRERDTPGDTRTEKL